MYGKKEVRKVKCTIMNIEELKLRAAAGDAEAQFELGKAYECGRDVVVNLWESVKWYRLAAKQGNSDAKRLLKRLNEIVSDKYKENGC